MVQGHQAFDSPATLPALLILLICTAALLWWLASAAPDVPSPEVHTRPGRFVLVLVLTVAVLFSLRVLVGPPLLFALPVGGLVVLALLRPRLRWLEVVYALLLALIAGVAGLGAGWVTFTPLTWAVLQVALVLVGLLVGEGDWLSFCARFRQVSGGLSIDLNTGGSGSGGRVHRDCHNCSTTIFP